MLKSTQGNGPVIGAGEIKTSTRRNRGDPGPGGINCLRQSGQIIHSNRRRDAGRQIALLGMAQNQRYFSVSAKVVECQAGPLCLGLGRYLGQTATVQVDHLTGILLCLGWGRIGVANFPNIGGGFEQFIKRAITGRA